MPTEIDYSKYQGHTPGEWFAEDVDGTGALSVCYDERPRNPRAGFPSMLGFCFADDEYGDGISYDEALANARLFADSPLLLSALREREAEVERLREAIRTAIRDLDSGAVAPFGVATDLSAALSPQPAEAE